MKNEWESVTESTARLKIYGGWLVSRITVDNDAIGLCFVPDAQHEWKL